MLAFLTCGVVVVLKWSEAACMGTWTYLFSVVTGMLSLRCMSGALGRQKLDNRLPRLDKEAIDAIDAKEELRLRGVFAWYWIQGMSLFCSGL
jgi:hypothetical protein